MHLKNITLELSSKPFFDDSEDTMRTVCQHLFRQWLPLLETADQVSVLLWLADGSEILEYTGDLNQTFEWAYWIGLANPAPRDHDLPPNHRARRNIHLYPQKYRPDVTPRTYGWLKRLTAVIRETGKSITGKPIRVGETFDNGPEFAISPFKYQRHREIALAHTAYPNSFVTCNAILHADPQPYAAFPQGIPEGTTLGHFLGRQFHAFARDLGFDYIWLSNGMGFGMETWGITGSLFDKHQFKPEKADQATAEMLRFWHDFTDACPGMTIETRGSNLSAGVEIATDAAPLRELYAKNTIVPPVNSPWAALNFNTGLEIAAWMSHVAELPGDIFPFRFYTHDPWWLNSPWLDRYGRQPWDIFLPLSICRITADGTVQTPNSIAFLSADDSLGRLPDQVPREVIPHLFEAFDNAPDAPGPLVLVYPFDEYSELVRGHDRHPDLVFNEDFFLGETIQCGTPLNTVISTGNFRRLAASGNTCLDASILIIPITATANPANWVAITTLLNRGVKAIFYGTLRLAPPELLALLGLRRASAVTGQVTISSSLPADTFEQGQPARLLHVLPQFMGGGLEATATSAAQVCVHARQGNLRRVVASRSRNGQVAFLQALLPANPNVSPSRHFDALPPDQSFPAPDLMRHLLADFGWRLHFQAWKPNTILPRINISRHQNAFRFALLARDTTAAISISTPYGAPILDEMETMVERDAAIWHPDKCWHADCRCFVKQQARTVIGCKILWPYTPGYTGRRLYTGLKNADVRFFPPPGFDDTFEAIVTEAHFSHPSHTIGLPATPPVWENTPAGPCALYPNVTGNIAVAW